MYCVNSSVGSLSCQGRCGEKYNSQNKCHCNTECGRHNNCCGDFKDLCGDGGEMGARQGEVTAVDKAEYSVLTFIKRAFSNSCMRMCVYVCTCPRVQ